MGGFFNTIFVPVRVMINKSNLVPNRNMFCSIYYFINEGECFIKVPKEEEIDESTRPKLSVLIVPSEGLLTRVLFINNKPKSKQKNLDVFSFDFLQFHQHVYIFASQRDEKYLVVFTTSVF